ncbi:MFS transporter [Clostridium sp. AF19-22AC]|mgnify:CR=1 FL=1|jgi:sugar (glycoside-pentoside-hexuronide) transporter|uniref:MFS transporter n=1 Tax=Clostridia TaxID=186801 RepID=UPI000E4B4ED5|nr:MULTISPECIES: glycoside-pentoside-hexuronide (GPH):cation symporter [Clostridia]RHR21296.1 MFS transporter [Clostridium sp. AF19-22AC]
MSEEKKTMMQKSTDASYSIPRRIAYALGGAGSQFSWMMISTYLTVFYTDVVGLTPMVISMIMLGARIWDAINDPMFGAIAENTKSRWGRYRPYILFGAPVLAIFSALCFLNLDISMPGKIAWCTVTYVLCGMAYTAVNISTASIVNSMTTKVGERVVLISYSNFFMSAAAMLLNAIAMPIILFFGNGSTSSGNGYFYAALLFAVVSLSCFWICGIYSKELIGNVNEKKQSVSGTGKNLINSFKQTFQDRNAIMLMIGMLLVLTAVMGRLGIMAYYFIYVIQDVTVIAGCATAISIGMAMPSLYSPILFKYVDKKICAAISCVFSAVLCVVLYLAAGKVSAPILIFIHFLYGASNCITTVVYSMSGEIIDDAWLRTGIRSDGVIYSCISFSTKLGNAVGGSVGILALGAVGFVANTEMGAGVLSKMNGVINFGPAVIFLLAIIPFMLIKMTNKKSAENELKLKELDMK